MCVNRIFITVVVTLFMSVSVAGCASSDDSTGNEEILKTADHIQETIAQPSAATPLPATPEEPAAALTDEIESDSEGSDEEPDVPGTVSPQETVTAGEPEPLPQEISDDIPGKEAAGLTWSFVEDDVDLGIAGVSPESILLDDGSVRLYVTDMGIVIYRAEDGLHFNPEPAPQLFGSDPTLIRLDDGSYRMYYVDMPQGNKEIWTATSSDGLNWKRESGTGIRNTMGGPAWGVPDTVELPDGSIRIYWVDMPTEGGFEVYEVIRSALSKNGTDFTIEEGYRTEDGYVDSYVLAAEEGNWIGLFSTTPAPSRLPQQIYLGISEDGLSWMIEKQPVIAVQGGNAIDPTAIQTGENTYRIYYGTTSDADPFGGFRIRSGVLTLGQ